MTNTNNGSIQMNTLQKKLKDLTVSDIDNLTMDDVAAVQSMRGSLSTVCFVLKQVGSAKGRSLDQAKTYLRSQLKVVA